MQRYERTRYLVKLGGLVQKAGLVESADNDMQVVLGAFLAIAAKLGVEGRERNLTLWRRRGRK